MRELYFYVEGETEQAYVTRVLCPHLAEFSVQVWPPIKPRKLTYGSLRHRLENELKEHRRPGVRFTTMFDLYALPTDFPGRAEAEKVRHLPQQRAQRMENAWADDIGDSRFVPHLQLYEFETILLCDPEAFQLYYEDCDKQVEKLRAMIAADGPPEQINDCYETAPSYRIDKFFPGYRDAKTTAGVEIASCIDLNTVRQRCPHFHAWLTQLEQLDQQVLPGE
jgi:hypothetical protein